MANAELEMAARGHSLGLTARRMALLEQLRAIHTSLELVARRAYA